MVVASAFHPQTSMRLARHRIWEQARTHQISTTTRQSAFNTRLKIHQCCPRLSHRDHAGNSNGCAELLTSYQELAIPPLLQPQIRRFKRCPPPYAPGWRSISAFQWTAAPPVIMRLRWCAPCLPLAQLRGPEALHSVFPPGNL